jgi:hypothetical protein
MESRVNAYALVNGKIWTHKGVVSWLRFENGKFTELGVPGKRYEPKENEHVINLEVFFFHSMELLHWGKGINLDIIPFVLYSDMLYGIQNR